MFGMGRSRDEWKGIANEAVSLSDNAMQLTASLISDMKYLEVVDFDDHLGDASENWLNPDLFKGHAISKLSLVAADS